MSRVSFAAIALAAILAVANAASAATVFSDTFGSSTLNSASPAAPTASASDYAVISAKNATGSSISAGSLKLQIGSTSSGLTEMQALFASSPVVLSNAGDSITLTVTFKPTNLTYIGAGTINFGLYDSNGATPVTGGQMNNSQLTTSQTAFASGNAATWTGYVGRIGIGTGAGGVASQLFTRAAQTDTTNESQDLLFSDVGTGAFDSPVGTVLGSTNNGLIFVNGNQYTYVLSVTRNGDGSLALAQSLYAGTDTSAVSLFTLSGAEAAPTTTEFSGLAFGFRAAGAPGTNHVLNLESVQVSTTVPEPASLAVLGLGSLGLLRRRRSQALS